LCTTPLHCRARSSFFWWSLSAYAHHISLGENTTFLGLLANYLPVRNAPPPAFSSTLQVPSLAVVLNPRPRLCFWRSMSPTYTTSPAQPATDTSLSALLASQQMNGHPQSMDARQQDYSQQAPLKQEYSQPGLNSPYASSSYTGNLSETLSSPDQNQAAQYHPDVRPSLSSTASSRSADCSRVRQSARSASFPEYQQQPQGQQQQPQRPYPEQGAPRYQQPGGHPHAAMAQSSRSLPLASALRDTRSDSAIAIDPTIAAQNPQYPQQHAYSPYPPQHEMHQYPGQPGAPMYAPRPEWGAYHAQPMHYAPVSAAGGPPGMAAAVPRPPHVSHSFVRLH